MTYQRYYAGADKVAINTAAIANPKLLSEAPATFGSQCIVASIETFRDENGKYEVCVDYGRERMGVDAVKWAKKVEGLGVGEILLTSINKEGMGNGFRHRICPDYLRARFDTCHSTWRGGQQRGFRKGDSRWQSRCSADI